MLDISRGPHDLEESPRRPHILVFAWLIGPDRGSEWSAAWGMALVAAELGDVTVVCRPDCEGPIRAWCARHPDVPIDVVAVPPREGWKTRHGRRLFMGHFLEYFAWLEATPGAVAALHRARPIDLAVHAALGCCWLPSPVAALQTPSIWGSVGGGTPVPFALLPTLGLGGILERMAERIAVAIGSWLPATRRTMRGATIVLAENTIVRDALPRGVAENALVFQRALLTDAPDLPAQPRGHEILFPSILTPRKGALLALEGFSAVPPPHRLVFANAGPDEERLRRRAVELGIDARVEFRGRVPRDEYFAIAKRAALAVFAGVNEDGGCALCEAMLLGVPVVVLANGGPKEIIDGWCTDPIRVIAVTPAGGAAATARALGDAMAAMIARAPERTDGYLDRAGAVKALKHAYTLAMGAPALSQLSAAMSPIPAGLAAAAASIPVEGAKTGWNMSKNA